MILFMNFLKNIKNLESEISALPKYYNSHVWITAPGADGLSFLGISQFAKRYFTRISRLNRDGYTKTNFGIENRAYIQAFIAETRERWQKGELKTAERIEWDRFQIKIKEPFAIMQAIEFDIQLQAPVDMRVLDFQLDTHLSLKMLSVPYYFLVEALHPHQLTTLQSEEQYLKSRKMFML